MIEPYSMVFYISGKRYTLHFSEDSNSIFEITGISTSNKHYPYDGAQVQKVRDIVGLQSKGIKNLIEIVTIKLKKLDKYTSCMGYCRNC